MRTVLVLSGLGILSLVLLSTVDTAPPVPVDTTVIGPTWPPQRGSTLVTEMDAAEWDQEAEKGSAALLSEESRRELVRERILPPSAASAPVLQYSIVSRAGPQRHLMVKKRAAPPVGIVIPPQFVPEPEPGVIPVEVLEERRFYSRAGPFHLKKKREKPVAAQIE